MRKHNPTNERIKRQYFTYLKEAKRHSEATVDAVAMALNRFEVYTGYRDFKAFHIQQAVGFKQRLAEQKSQQSGENLSKATLNSTLAHLKRFFQWLAGQPGYKSKLQYADAEYFNLSEKDTRIATTRREKRVPSLEQVKHVIANMPFETEIDRRNWVFH
jgi:site-specific recombinase XerD